MTINFPYRYRVVVILFFLIFICQLDRVAISLLGVRIKSAFHLNDEKFGWVISAFALAYALFEIPSGIMGDRIGQRSVFIRIVLWWSLFTALTGMTTGLASLLLVRFLFGAGEAGAWPNALATVSRWMPAKEASRGFSSIAVGGTMGQVIAPFIVVSIAAAFGWRAPFFVIALFGLLWVIVCFSWFRSNPSEMKNITSEERVYIETNRRIETHHLNFSWRVALKSRNILVLTSMYFCCNLGWSFYIFWMPNYVQEVLHLSEHEMMNLSALIYLGGVLSGFIVGILSDWLVKKIGLKFGRRLIGITSLSIAALLFFLMGSTTNTAVAIASLFVAFFFILANAVPSFSTCIDVGGNNVGGVTGIMNTGGQTAAFLIGIVVGKLSHITHSFTIPLFLIGSILICGAILWLLIDPTKKLLPEETKSTQEVEVVPVA